MSDEMIAVTGKSSPISADKSENHGKWKRHEFTDYLTENGVTSAVANAILELSRTEEPRPVDPIEFLRNRMLPDNGDVREIRVYRREIEGLKRKADAVRAERDRLLALKQRLRMIYDGECDGTETFKH